MLIRDQVRHRYFHLPGAAGNILRHWPLGRAGAVAKAAGAALEDVGDLAEFLARGRLTLVPAGGSGGLIQERASHGTFLTKLIHRYLFFRVPLVDPTRLLDRLLPLALVLGSRAVFVVLVLTGIAGVYLTTRQWDRYTSTFLDFLTPQGFLLYGATLILLKVAHELGHAFVARAKGCNVPVMGIAVMLLAPMLYTETSDAWRLPKRKDRMLIDAAGVLVELALAAVALLLWPFLPDGSLRSAAFFVSSTAIVMSIAVNASPFMRFDGYHLLGDGLGVYNLGQRSFELGRWHLRELLFRPGDAPPELLPRRLMGGLIAYAYGTWVYRFSLFLGIAVLIYHMFPKAIGLPLFLVEIHMFILKPVLKEISNWSADRTRLFVTPRSRMTFLVLAVLVLLGLLPIDRQIQVPAVLLPAQEAQIFPPEAGELVEVLVKRGAHVGQGDVLFRLRVPDIIHRKDLVSLRLSIVNSRLARVAADAGDRAQSAVLQREAAQLEQELAGLAARQERLTVRSPVSGTVTSLEDGLRPGAWIGASALLAHVAAPEGAILAGLGAASDVPRLSRGAAAVFVAESGEGASLAARLEDVSAPAAGVAFLYLSSLQGGPVAMEADPRGGPPIPVNGVLPLRFAVESAAPPRAVRGTALVDANPRSALGAMAARVAYVLLRESGF